MVDASVLVGFRRLTTSPLVIGLLKKGYSYLDLDVDQKLQDLQNVIIQIERLIKTAENSPDRDRLCSWLRTLEDAVGEAEDMLDLYDYHILKQKARSSAAGITDFLVPLEGGPFSDASSGFETIETCVAY